MERTSIQSSWCRWSTRSNDHSRLRSPSFFPPHPPCPLFGKIMISVSGTAKEGSIGTTHAIGWFQKYSLSRVHNLVCSSWLHQPAWKLCCCHFRLKFTESSNWYYTTLGLREEQHMISVHLTHDMFSRQIAYINYHSSITRVMWWTSVENGASNI